MKLRPATHADLPLLAPWNRELIEDERALAFWRAVGMREHAIGFRLP